MDDDLLADLDDLGDDAESVAESEMSTEHKDDLESLTETNRSKRLGNALKKVELYTTKKRSDFYNSGPVEQDPEYVLIVEANKLVVELEFEISQVHKVIIFN
jgi:U4/U6 small nuclear ribonucleoprotein PRP31